ncbi:MAG: hypothetical protein Q6353_017920 [Candidatus Sigynarchaeum springense]
MRHTSIPFAASASICSTVELAGPSVHAIFDFAGPLLESIAVPLVDAVPGPSRGRDGTARVPGSYPGGI